MKMGRFLMLRATIFVTVLLTAGTVMAQGVPSLSVPGTGTLNPGQGAPPPPTKKLPNGDCVPPNAPNYAGIRNFVPFVSLEDCLKSGGKLAKAGLPMGAKPN